MAFSYEGLKNWKKNVYCQREFHEAYDTSFEVTVSPTYVNTECRISSMKEPLPTSNPLRLPALQRALSTQAFPSFPWLEAKYRVIFKIVCLLRCILWQFFFSNKWKKNAFKLFPNIYLLIDIFSHFAHPQWNFLILQQLCYKSLSFILKKKSFGWTYDFNITSTFR